MAMTDQAEIKHLNDLRHIVAERRRWLEKQLANYGVSEAPVHLLMNLDNTKEELAGIDERLVQLGASAPSAGNSDLLERVSYLEQELAKIRKHLAIQSSLRRGLPWREQWYNLEEESITIYGKHGASENYKEYRFREMLDITEEESLYVDYVLSPDEMCLAIKIGNGLLTFMSRVYPEEYTQELDKQVLYLFRFGAVEPLFSTDNSKFVNCPPAFSEDGQLLAFSYSHNWRQKLWMPETHASEPPSEVAEPFGIVEWDETLSVIEIDTGHLRDLYTEVSSGYARWAEPHHFFDLSFIQLDSVVFGISIGGRGVLQSWNVPLDGTAPTIVPNPFFE
jgi:hypothetical protein